MTESDSGSTPEAVVRAFYDSWDEIGFDAGYKKYLADDVVVWNPGLGEWHGLDTVIAGLTAYMAAFGRPFCTVDLKHIASDGDIVLTERVETNRNEDSSSTFTGPLMSRFRVEGDKIKEWFDYYDPAPYKFGEAVPMGQLAWKE